MGVTLIEEKNRTKGIFPPTILKDHALSALKPVHWDDPEGWDGEGGGRGVQDGNTCTSIFIHVNSWQKPPQYCKVISLQWK